MKIIKRANILVYKIQQLRNIWLTTKACLTRIILLKENDPHTKFHITVTTYFFFVSLQQDRVTDSSIVISSFEVKMSKSVSIQPPTRQVTGTLPHVRTLFSPVLYLLYYLLYWGLTKNNDDCIWGYYDPVTAIFAIKPRIVFSLTQ